MKKQMLLIAILVLPAVTAAAQSTAAAAQNYELVHVFPADGRPESGLIQAKDGYFYGTTYNGGVLGAGTVFRMDASGTVTTLHDFTVADGDSPRGPLLQAADGNFYGVTTAGGPSGAGTIFRVSPSGVFATLHNFTWGSEVVGFPLIQGWDGYFYGTLLAGGASGLGAIFRMDSSGNVTILHSFNGLDGGSPGAPLVQAADGNFYGMTSDLEFFRMESSGVITLLAKIPHAWGPPSLGRDGYFYGTTAPWRCIFGFCWGTTHGGTAFKIDSHGILSTLHTFGYSDGVVELLVQASDRNFYGRTGGYVFKMDTSGTVTTLRTISSEGLIPNWPLIQAGDGQFYGTTVGGGTAGYGTAIRMDSAGNVATLHSFSSIGGTAPVAALIRAKDGSLYGTASSGGANAVGTIFRITPPGSLSTLHTFNGADGATPAAALLQTPDGNFFATTSNGGAHGYGTAFRMATSGALATLHDFNKTDGANPQAALILGSDGNFYGSTAGGGANGFGTVFKMEPSGNLTTLHSFNIKDGAYPTAALLQAKDGKFYGTTPFYGEGPNAGGTLFRMDASGILTTLHTFDSTGAGPSAPLIEADDDSLYGTTCCAGTVFKVDSSGAFTTVHSFGAGETPHAALLQAADGDFYGTTSAGVFKMDSSDAVTTLHSFNVNGTDGADPRAALVQAADGSFYGTARGGGPSGQGVVFRLGTASLAVNSVTPASGPAAGGTGVRVLGGGFLAGAGLTIGGGFATGVRVTDPTSLLATVPALSPGTLNDVSVSTPTSSDSVLSRAYFADFLDVPQGYLFHRVIEGIFRAGMTLGCGGGNYCPGQEVSRSQIVILLARAMAGGSANIPSRGSVGGNVYDCTPEGVSLYTDVAPWDTFCKHVHYLAAKNVNPSCGASRFCPASIVTRLPMAGLVAGAIVAPGGDTAVPATYGPDPATGLSYSCDAASPRLHFSDLSATDPLCRHAHFLWARGVIAGCGTSQYCPFGDVTRDQMAKFLVNAFRLQLDGS
jgi:uncharacterized repeat protein (TIGR03803 family)